MIFSQEALKHPDFTRCVFSPRRLVVMAPKKMAADAVEQSEVKATPSTQMTDDVEQPEVQATPSMQMTDDQLLQLAVSSDFQEKVGGSSSDSMADIWNRMRNFAINYNKNLKSCQGYIKDINKEDRQIRQQLAKAKAQAKIEAKKVENAATPLPRSRSLWKRILHTRCPWARRGPGRSQS